MFAMRQKGIHLLINQIQILNPKTTTNPNWFNSENV